MAAQSGVRIGVLELYLPYAPIAADTMAGEQAVGLALVGGLFVVWACLLGVSASVTRRLRRQSSTNAFLARHDVLTGMPNRAQFTQRAEAAIPGATVERPVAIALIDLDRFKEVNDTLGHENGDQLLMLLAERLKLYVREGDTIARLGGDEFGVVLSGVRGPGEAAEVLGRLRATVSQPVQINGLPLAVEASIGFALAPEDGTDIGTLQQRADVAMYVAKRGHSGIARYRREQDQYDASKLSLIGELGRAIAKDQLVLHYQPKGDVHGAKVIAVEALVRWQHPTRGLLYPDAFLPAAEQTELIEDLTRWVLRSASLALPQLDPTGQLAVAVNISARSLGRADFAADVLSALAEAGTDPARVILEITETALMADPARASRTLVELARAGLRISIDDFGAGSHQPGLPGHPADHRAQDRQGVRVVDADRRPQHRDRPVGHRARARARLHGDRRGRRDDGDAAPADRPALRHRAGLPARPAGPRRRPAGPAGRGADRPAGQPGSAARPPALASGQTIPPRRKSRACRGVPSRTTCTPGGRAVGASTAAYRSW